MRVFVVNAVYFSGLDDHIRADLDSAQSSRRISGEKWITRACGKYHDAAFFEVSVCAPDDEGLADSLHLYRALYAHVQTHAL